MYECVSMSTPMATKRPDADLQGTPTDQTNYHQMIRGLKYLTTSHPDIVAATFFCDRYQACLMLKHLKEVKQIFQYLRQSYNMGLWYSKEFGFELIAYSNADHAGCKDDCKSTSGGLQFLGLEVGWIWRIHVLDTAYWGFLGVGTTFDIFQNIILIPYLEYGVLSPLDTAY
ncbi:hypothetical protein Tco_0759570 [Tanacetum coccineum]